MTTQLQKKLAADLLKCSPSRVKLSPEKMEQIKEAITKEDVRKLIREGTITKEQKQGVSRARAKENQAQKRKGRRRGHGSRKGTEKARGDKKGAWMNTARAQRRALQTMKSRGEVSQQTYRSLYNKIHGGFFRSVRHLRTYVQESK